MSVPNQTPYIIYNANGLTTVFPFEFYIINAADLQVSINGTAITSGYSVSGTGNVGGGDVTFITPPASGSIVMLERVVPTYRLTDYQDNGDLLADTVNKDFDRLWMAIQRSFIYLGLALRRPLLGGPYNAEGYRISHIGEPQDKQDAATKNYVDNVGLVRALRVPENFVSVLPPIDQRANKLLAFNAAGQPITVLPPSGSASDVLIELAKPTGASLIGYGDGTVADKLDELKTPFDFGAKGDGVTDDTLALQAYIDGVDGDIDLYGKTYLVSKNPALATTYPTEPDFANNGYNFCPCLAIVNKTNKKIFNGTLVVKQHGQSVLTFINSRDCSAENLSITAPGIFPSLSGNTGFGEKGDSTGGYNTMDGGLLLGPNNSIDTSAYTLGKYNNTSGQFPIYDTSWQPTGGYKNNWGVFNGGYIGSYSAAIQVQRACVGITISNCYLCGFNGSGVWIGIRNEVNQTGFIDYSTDADVPRGTVVKESRIQGCYTAGIWVVSGYDIRYTNNRIEDIGHPSSNDTLDTDFNPGYGVTTSRFRRIRDIIVTDNYISNCKRKSIDFHGGGRFVVSNNICLRGGLDGVYLETGYGWDLGFEPFNAIITNNYITTRAIAKNFCFGIFAAGTGAAPSSAYPYPFIKICNNYMEANCVNATGVNIGRQDNDYHFEDILVSGNTCVYNCDQSLTPGQYVAYRINLNTANSTLLPKQSVKLVSNSFKCLATMANYNFGTPINITGQMASLIATGNTIDMGGFNIGSSAWFATFIPNNVTDYSFSGNKLLNYSKPSTLRQSEIMFYENIELSSSANTSIAMTWLRGVWDISLSGTGSLAGARTYTLASDGTAINTVIGATIGAISTASSVSSSNIGFTISASSTCNVRAVIKSKLI
ncbi:TPA: right-handed parallel beta-helix repeat-containing protein [Enterobacter hormaechei]|nr:right-handed parallel beta-helix repeat-containing protein [Enterobacter hormaechei]